MPSRQLNVADLFEIVAAEVPDRGALVAGDVRLTYGELDERSNRFAHALVGFGVQPGDKVGIYSWNRAEWVEAFLGSFKARAVPVNINYRYVADELHHVLDDTDVTVLVVERSFLPMVAGVRHRLPLLRVVVVIEDGSEEAADRVVGYEDVLAGAGPAPLGIERSADDLYLLYTGGTTGQPKGVMWRHEDIFFAALSAGQVAVSSADEITRRITPEDGRAIFMITAPVMHGAANWAMLICLLAGGTNVLYTGRGFDAHEVLGLIETHRVTSAAVVGDAMARPIADALLEHEYDMSSLKSFGSGGAVFSTSVREQLAKYMPNAMIIDTFGSSEMGASGLAPPGGAARVFYCNEQQTVLGEDLRPVQAGSGQVGLMARRGHIPLGYYKDQKKTATTFVVDPAGVRWVIPGDYATIEEDGRISVLGRGSNCINTGGEKVYPEEVESVLKGHEDVFDVLVIGVPDERFTERVAAVVQARDGRSPTLAELQAHCREHVAGYKVPREVVLVEEVPRSASGKPDYRTAKELLLAGRKPATRHIEWTGNPA